MTNLQLGTSTRKCFHCLKVEMIRKGLDITIHQVILCKLIFAVYDLPPLTLRQRESARPWLHQHAINTAPASLKRLKNQIRVYGSTSAKCHAYSNSLACSSTHGRTTSLYVFKSTPSNWLNTCRFPTCKSIEHWLDMNILSCFPHFSLNGMPAYQDFNMFKKNQISWWKSHLSMFLNKLKSLGENFTQTKSERKRAAYNQGSVSSMLYELVDICICSKVGSSPFTNQTLLHAWKKGTLEKSVGFSMLLLENINMSEIQCVPEHPVNLKCGILSVSTMDLVGSSCGANHQ